MLEWVRMVVTLLFVHPHDHVAGWVLWLPAAAQHHERVSIWPV